MKKILICGAGGFIGGHLAKMFDNEKNHENYEIQLSI